MFFRQLFSALVCAALFLIFSCQAFAQGFKQELEAPEKVELTVRNLDGRVSVVAAAEQQKKVTVEAKSAGAMIGPTDVHGEAKRGGCVVHLAPRGAKGRIDVVATMLSR